MAKKKNRLDLDSFLESEKIKEEQTIETPKEKNAFDVDNFKDVTLSNKEIFEKKLNESDILNILDVSKLNKGETFSFKLFKTQDEIVSVLNSLTNEHKIGKNNILNLIVLDFFNNNKSKIEELFKAHQKLNNNLFNS